MKLLLFAQMSEIWDKAVMNQNLAEKVSVTEVSFKINNSL